MSGGKRRRGASLIQVTRKSGALSEDERDLAQRMRARGLGWAAVAGAVGRPIPTLQAALAPRPQAGEGDAHG